MSKHTKGKWEVEICGETLATYIVTKDNENIAQLSWTVFGADREEIDANARLIASAPELLEACKLANRWFEKLTQDKDFVSLDIELCRLLNLANNIIKQAIAKVEAI